MASMRRICAGGIQPVRVVHGDGQVLHLAPNVRVADMVTKYPHHYMCNMSPDQYNKSPMLPLDTELEPGSVYFLLPLPRLFPNPGNSTCTSCSCFMHDRSQHGGGSDQSPLILKGGFSPFVIKQMIMRIGSPLRTPKKKVSPEISRQLSSTEPSSTNPYSPNFGKDNYSRLSPVYKHKRSNSSPKRCKSPKSKSRCNSKEREPLVCNRWKPRLGCISETDALVVACDELRLSLDRRRLTFERNGRPCSPLKTGEFSRSPLRELRTPKNSQMSPPRQGMPLSGYVLM